MTFNIRFFHPLSLQISTFTGTCVWICISSDFIRLYLDDLQKNLPNPYFGVIWFCLTYPSPLPAQGKAIRTSGIPCAGSLGSAVCPGALGSHRSPSSPIPTSRVSKKSREHGLALKKNQKNNTLPCPFHAQFLSDLCRPFCGTPGHALSGEEAGLGGAQGAFLPSTAD